MKINLILIVLKVPFYTEKYSNKLTVISKKNCIFLFITAKVKKNTHLSKHLLSCFIKNYNDAENIFELTVV